MERKPIKSALKQTSLIILFAAIISEGVGILILFHTKTPHSTIVLLDSNTAACHFINTRTLLFCL